MSYQTNKLFDRRANELSSYVAHKLGGFTLLELLMVIGIIAILAAAGFGVYGNFVENVQLEAAEKNIIFDLKNVRSRSMAGESELKWGIHFVGSTSTDYYELFSTPTDYSSASTTIEETVFLQSGTVFTSPSSGSTTDAIFNKITGTATSTSVTISSDGETKTINISSIGSVY